MHKLNPEQILEALRSDQGCALEGLPSSSGVYALRNHNGEIRYVGIAHSEGFRTRIRNKHATGSEDRSHKFSAAYNCGRLWRDRHNGCPVDGPVSKRLRNSFILKHCSASIFPIDGYDSKADLERIEREIIAHAREFETAWNRKVFPVEGEPKTLVDELIGVLRMTPEEIAAIERQAKRFKDFSR